MVSIGSASLSGPRYTGLLNSLHPSLLFFYDSSDPDLIHIPSKYIKEGKIVYVCVSFMHGRSSEARKLKLCMKVYFYTGTDIGYVALCDKTLSSLEATITKNGICEIVSALLLLLLLLFEYVYLCMHF